MKRMYSNVGAWVRPLRWVFAAWDVHEMNARKPPTLPSTSTAEST